MNKNRSWAGWAAVMAVLVAGAFNAEAAVPRPEHPRPDLFRENWMTLNGERQFEIDRAADGDSRGSTYGTELNAKIIAPFCPESELSGLGLGNTQRLKDVWYRRQFEVPPAMKGRRIRIHFGGVDYGAWVYVNGQKILGVRGFINHYELRLVTDKLKPVLKPGANTLAVYTRQTVGGQYIDLAVLVD